MNRELLDECFNRLGSRRGIRDACEACWLCCPNWLVDFSCTRYWSIWWKTSATFLIRMRLMRRSRVGTTRGSFILDFTYENKWRKDLSVCCLPFHSKISARIRQANFFWLWWRLPPNILVKAWNLILINFSRRHRSSFAIPYYVLGIWGISSRCVIIDTRVMSLLSVSIINSLLLVLSRDELGVVTLPLSLIWLSCIFYSWLGVRNSSTRIFLADGRYDYLRLIYSNYTWLSITISALQMIERVAVRRTRKGWLGHLLKQTYPRDDIPCGIEQCSEHSTIDCDRLRDRTIWDWDGPDFGAIFRWRGDPSKSNRYSWELPAIGQSNSHPKSCWTAKVKETCCLHSF